MISVTEQLEGIYCLVLNFFLSKIVMVQITLQYDPMSVNQITQKTQKI
jgi:hypothetical protein